MAAAPRGVRKEGPFSFASGSGCHAQLLQSDASGRAGAFSLIAFVFFILPSLIIAAATALKVGSIIDDRSSAHASSSSLAGLA